MATISAKSWDRYINALRKLNAKATNRMLAKINEVGTDDREALEELIRYAYGIATRYGEGASALSAEMYDALAELSGKIVPPAVPAPTASYGDVAKAVYGTDLQSKNPQVMADSIGRLVKMAGVDTMQQNALRDGAEWAWIPRGDTCAFCIMLASNGWQKASKKAIKNGHAMHIHANCDCTYAIRFNSDVDVEGYNNGKEYRDMYYGAEGSTPEERINFLRRAQYTESIEEKLQKQIDETAEKINQLFSQAANDPANLQYYSDEITKQTRKKSSLEFKKQAELNYRLFNDPAVVAERENTLRPYINKIKNNERETLVLVDREGNVLLVKEGGKNSVSFEGPKDKNYISLHNHPGGTVFSVEDVEEFCRNEFEMQVQAKGGPLYKIQRDFKNENVSLLNNFPAEYKKAWKDAYERASDEVMMSEKALEMPFGELEKEVKREADKILIRYLKENADKYGYIFMAV